MILPTFAQPWILALLLIVPAVVVAWRRRSPGSLRYSSLRLLRDLPRGRANRAQRGGWLLRGFGLVLLIVALAGPRWPDPASRLPSEGTALCLVLDVSRSMDSRDFLWDGEVLTRLDGIKRIFRLFVEGGHTPDGSELPGRPQDLVGLVTFATRPETACPLTLDHKALGKILDEVEARTLITEAATNPGDALAWALATLQRAPTKRKAIVFLTDGEANVPPPALHPRQAAQLAGNLNIPIYVIDANPDASPDEDAERARQILQDVARIAGGEYFRASDAASLGEVTARIDSLERSQILSFRYARYHEGFAWFALGSLASWFAILLLEATVWRRFP